jgi:nucleotide-binding universal stress UspA family protein
MRGTILCGVTDSEAGRGALELAAVLSERLGLRLVVAHVADGIAPVGGGGNGDESVTTRANREGAARLVARLAAEHGLAGSAEERSAVGDPAALLAQIAAEEGADMIVIGSRARPVLARSREQARPPARDGGSRARPNRAAAETACPAGRRMTRGRR